ncbi:MAG TPA: HepT-like ribonuclease domain-containing protein [Pirellulales bacterium]|jgi:uncharacterized protein with HEPN domain|nr:HepT-like ribonuclease domain-containing protein [Pirellulales bacterium]
MTRRDDTIRIENMLDHSREAVELANGKSRADLDDNRVFNLALTRLLEIVGEAAARVSQVTRDKYSQIPWLAIAGLRNRLIHGYDEVDFDVLWDVVQNDLPTLIVELEAIAEG